MKSDTLVMNQFKVAFKLAQNQVKALIEKHPGFYPDHTACGKWKHSGEKWSNWCDGFLPGQMWIFHRSTGDPYWLEGAIRYSKPLEQHQHNRDAQDLGFIFFSTYLPWMQDLQKSDPAKAAEIEDILIQAGKTLSMRFKEKGRYLCSALGEASTVIDNMMNVGLIFYAAQRLKRRGVKGSSELLRVANAHCHTTLRALLRGDGSTAQEALFNMESGECARMSTQQGYRSDSCWARGLAWAIHGFCTAYSFTGHSPYLDASEACARFFIAHTPDHGVPPWDFDAPPDSRRLEDSSAAAIAAAGLYNLSQVSASFEKRLLYRHYFLKIMTTLTSTPYLGRAPDWEGTLKHSVFHLPKKLGVDESSMWGDYFFADALSKALRDESIQ